MLAAIQGHTLLKLQNLQSCFCQHPHLRIAVLSNAEVSTKLCSGPAYAVFTAC